MQAQTDLQVTVGAQYTPQQLREMVNQNGNIVASDPGREFLQGRAPYVNNAMLVHVPFMFVSGWMERHQDAKTFPSGKSYPAHQVVQVWIRTLNPETYDLFDAELATFTGEFLLNQFRGATTNELQNGGPWTLRPHPTLSMAKYGKPDIHPLMLALWSPVKDRLEDDGSGVLASSFGMANGDGGVPEKVGMVREPVFGAGMTLTTALAHRGLVESDFLRYTGWNTVGGHSNEQIRQALELIDRVMKLATVESGADVASATESIKTPRTRK